MLVSQTIQQPTASTSKIGVYCHWLLTEGFKEQTIQSHSRVSRFLAKNCNLADPETVRQFIATRRCSTGRKENLVEIYAKFATYQGISF